MTAIPLSVAESCLSEKLHEARMIRVHQGKVRDTYGLTSHKDKLLVVASDRLSIFDFVLPCLVPKKGEVLTALTIFWLVEFFKEFFIEKGINHHLVDYGRCINPYLPDEFKDDPELLPRALIVRELDIVLVECIVRGYLTGSGWRTYQKNQEVCGHKLPPGLHDGMLFFYKWAISR